MGFKPINEYENEEKTMKVQTIINDVGKYVVIFTGNKIVITTDETDEPVNVLIALSENEKFKTLDPKTQEEIMLFSSNLYTEDKTVYEDSNEHSLTTSFSPLPFKLKASYSFTDKKFSLEVIDEKGVIVQKDTSKTPIWDNLSRTNSYMKNLATKNIYRFFVKTDKKDPKVSSPKSNISSPSVTFEGPLFRLRNVWADAFSRWEQEKSDDNFSFPPLLAEMEKNIFFRIHPSLTISDKITSVGAVLPLLNEMDGIDDTYCIITDTKKIIPCRPKEMVNEKIILTEPPIVTDNNWSTEHVRAYLGRNATTEPIRTTFNAIKKMYEEFIDFPEKNCYDFMSLWTIGTYFHPLFHAYPYVYLNGTRECGKSKVIRLTTLMSFNGIQSSNISAASMFRIIQSRKCTMGVDESEALMKDEQRGYEIRNILLGGYEQGNPVYRVEKDGVKGSEVLVCKRFDNYCPKIIGNIEGVEDVLGSRVIPITMLRTNKKQGKTEVFLEDPRWPEIRNKLYLYLMSNHQLVKETYGALDKDGVNIPGVDNRNLQLWKPMLTLAKLVGQDVYDEMEKMAKDKSREKHNLAVLESFDLTVLYVLADIFRLSIDNVKSDDKVTLYSNIVTMNDDILVSTIKEKIIADYDEQEKYVSSRRIGRAMTRLGFTDRKHTNHGSSYHIKTEDVLDRIQRYVPKKEIISESADSPENHLLSSLEHEKRILEFMKGRDVDITEIVSFGVEQLKIEPGEVHDLKVHLLKKNAVMQVVPGTFRVV